MTLGELQAVARMMQRTNCQSTQFIAAEMLGKRHAQVLLRVRLEQILIMAEANSVNLDELAADMESEWRGKRPESNMLAIK